MNSAEHFYAKIKHKTPEVFFGFFVWIFFFIFFLKIFFYSTLLIHKICFLILSVLHLIYPYIYRTFLFVEKISFYYDKNLVEFTIKNLFWTRKIEISFSDIFFKKTIQINKTMPIIIKIYRKNKKSKNYICNIYLSEFENSDFEEILKKLQNIKIK